MKPIAIIIPVHNSGKLLQVCIDCIINRTSYPFKIILIESESTDGTDQICESYARDYENIEVYHVPKEGIVKAMNFGIQMADDLDIFITQDDVIIPRLYKRDWLTEIVNCSKGKNVGMVTTIRGGGISGPDYIDGMPWVGSWSMFIPRSTIKKIGSFDENFSPGCGDDIDYTYRVYNAGLNVAEANFWIDHHRVSEHINEDKEIIKEHARYFRQKWKLGEFK